MTRRSLLVPIVAGFGVTLLILLAVIATSISQIDSIGSEMTSIVVERGRKAELASQMQNLHRQRYQSLVLASHLQDPFARDEELQVFASLAVKFMQMRDEFLGLSLDPAEQTLWDTLRGRLQQASDQTAAIVDLLERGQVSDARSMTEHTLAPLQQQMMADWEALARLQDDRNRMAIADAAKAEQRIRNVSLSLGGAALLIGIAIASFAIRAGRRLERHQHATSAQLQLILDSLPDAVLHCSKGAEIRYANHAARQLLGQRPVVGAKLADRLTLVDRITRAPLTAEVCEELQRGNPFTLPVTACLVSSEGMEFEVEGGGIPLRNSAGSEADAIFSLRDVTEYRENQRRQPGQVEIDDITGLPVARVLVERLERNLLSKRAVDKDLSYLHIELDGAAQLAADAGRGAAQQLVREAGQVMLSRLRDSDTLARVGEHAFGLLLPACPQEVSERLLRTLEESVRAMNFIWQGKPYPITARIGIVHAPPFAGAYDECQALAVEAAASKAR